MRLLATVTPALLLFCSILPAQFTMFPAVRGTREMIAGANNFEVEAGYRILSAGGNVVDAGVAAILAASVTEQARFGLGGEMPLLIKMQGKPIIAISGIGTAPALATVETYRKRTPEPWEKPGQFSPIPGQGIRAAILPGALSGLLLALEQYGTKSFSEVWRLRSNTRTAFPWVRNLRHSFETDSESSSSGLHRVSSLCLPAVLRCEENYFGSPHCRQR